MRALVVVAALWGGWMAPSARAVSTGSSAPNSARAWGAAAGGGLTSRAVELLDGAVHSRVRGTSWVVGGWRVGVSEAPWQVDLWSKDDRSIIHCGGAILDAVTVLTAAHCVEGTKPGAAPDSGGLAVWAGTSSITKKTATAADRAALQERRVASARVHPAYDRRHIASTGDLAVLRLARPLVLDGVRTAPIALPPAAPVPVAPPLNLPATLSVTGFGLTRGGGTTDGRLRQLEVSVADPDECYDDDNAIEFCGRTADSAPCSGDSGGPAVAAGPVLAGIVSNGEQGCPVGGLSRYVNLYAPENRDFVLGATAPPLAPRLDVGRARFVERDARTPRAGQRLTCEGGTFTGATAVRTVISTADDDTVLLVGTGGTATLTLTDAHVGRYLRCRSYGSSPGGIAVSRASETLLPVHERSEQGVCEGSSGSAVVRVRVPKRARRGASFTVVATLADPNQDAGAALLVVNSSAAGFAPKRRVSSVSGVPRQIVVRMTYRIPKSAPVGLRLRLQILLATFVDRTSAQAAHSLDGVCDVGGANAVLRVVR